MGTWGMVALVMVSVPLIGLTEQPLKQVPEVAEVSKDQEPLAGVFSGQARYSAAWLDLHGGRSRAANREPDLMRYEF